MVLEEIIMVGSENHTKHINALCVQNVGFFLTLNLVAQMVTTGLGKANQWNCQLLWIALGIISEITPATVELPHI